MSDHEIKKEKITKAEDLRINGEQPESLGKKVKVSNIVVKEYKIAKMKKELKDKFKSGE